MNACSRDDRSYKSSRPRESEKARTALSDVKYSTEILRVVREQLDAKRIEKISHDKKTIHTTGKNGASPIVYTTGKVANHIYIYYVAIPDNDNTPVY